MSNQNHYNPSPLVYVPNDAVSEVSLLQNQFSPEFGGGSGGIFNVIVKTGTNAVHGSIYEYLQNRDLNAVDSVYATQGLTSLPRYDNNRLGATIGGPILKDKLFYFGNFEYNPVGQSAVPGTPIIAPTAAGVSLLNGIAGLNSTNLGVFEKYVPVAPANDQGSVTVSGISIPVGSISTISPSYTNSYNAIVALDYNVSEKDQLRGRGYTTRIKESTPAPSCRSSTFQRRTTITSTPSQSFTTSRPRSKMNFARLLVGTSTNSVFRMPLSGISMRFPTSPLKT